MLPFSEFLDYDSFAVRLDELTFQRDPPKELAALLADISPDCVAAMRRRARHVALAVSRRVCGAEVFGDGRSGVPLLCTPHRTAAPHACTPMNAIKHDQ